jgi:hypothetical protein
VEDRMSSDVEGFDSHSFQALELYGKLGYEVWAVLDGVPSPHRQCYLKKPIR